MNYLGKLNNRQGNVALSLYHFCAWSNLDPNQLLALKSDYNSLQAEKLLDSLANAKVNFPEKRKWHVAQCVRGFFRTNYRQLQAQAGRSMPYAPSETHSLPTKKTRLKLFKACRNPRDQALVMIGTCTAIALETMSNLRWDHFEEDWQKQEIPHISIPPELLKGHGKGKYRGVRQETFTTPETKAILIDYRDWFSKTFNYAWKEEDHVFLSVKRNIGEPLSYRLIAKKSAILEERADIDFTIHDGRRITQTALENAGCPNNWIKKIKGRKVSGEEAPYSKPLIEQLRVKYKEALPDLEFLHEGAQALDEKKLRNKIMLDFAKLQGYEPDRLKKLEEVLARAKDPDEAIAEFRKLGEEAQGIDVNKPKNIIVKGDTELLKKLDDGYKLVESLNDNKFLMKI
jgi:DNA-binding Lrp family transcriptional regulator